MSTPDRFDEQGRPTASLRRFTGFKYAAAGLLLLLLVVSGVRSCRTTQVDRPGAASSEHTRITDADAARVTRGTESAPGAGSAAATRAAASGAAAGGMAGSAGGPSMTGPAVSSLNQGEAAKVGAPKPRTALSLRYGPRGQIIVGGMVDNDATRDAWLNAIRIAARGRPVDDLLRTGSGPTAPEWESRVGELAARIGERRLDAVQLSGDELSITGAARDERSWQALESDIERLLPPGVRLSARAGQPAAGQPATATAAAAAAGQGAASMARTAPATSSASAPVPAPGPPANAAPAPDGLDSGLDAPGRRGTGAAGSRTANAAGAAAEDVRREGASISARSCPRSLATLSGSVNFATGRADLSLEDRNRLGRLGQCLRGRSIRLTGHADARSSASQNLELSQRRAQAVAEAIRAGADRPIRLGIVAAGETQAAAARVPSPAAQGAPGREAATASGPGQKREQALSRRVDIQVR